MSQWTQVVDGPGLLFQLVDDVNFRFLRTCASFDCEYNEHALRNQPGAGIVDQVIQKQENKGWSLVETRDGIKSGWILTRELQSAQ